MELASDMGEPDHREKAVALNDCQPPEDSSKDEDTSTTDMLRIKDQMSNQCFEMVVKLSAGSGKKSCSISEAERDLPDYVSELEDAKTVHFNKMIALHRMQMWHAIAEKLKQNDSESEKIKVVSDRCMGLCSLIKDLQQESRELEDQITEIQKKRLELKRLLHQKMKEMDELLHKKDLPSMDVYKSAREKGQANLEKYRRMAFMTQNVLRGMLLACKVNWMDDPKIRDIAMTLEDLPTCD